MDNHYFIYLLIAEDFHFQQGKSLAINLFVVFCINDKLLIY
jgi:hypothetical protein